MKKRVEKKKRDTLKKLVKAHNIPYKLISDISGYTYKTVRAVMASVRKGSEFFWLSVRKLIMEWRALTKGFTAFVMEERASVAV